MGDKTDSLNLKAIGAVRSEFKQPIANHNWEEVVSQIVVNPELEEALDNLEEFSHIIVLYWMHRRSSPKPPNKIHPRGDSSIPLKGLFATRSPNRPNSIGKATVRLLERRGNTLKVQGLDAIDGTPVIDIKPYIPGYDSPADARAPSCVTRK